LLGHVLDGWEVSGITTFVSGLSQTLSQPVDPFACTVPDPNTPASPTSPLCAANSPSGTYPGGLGMVSPNADILPRPDQVAPIHLTKTATQWFTTNSFSQAEGHFGTAGVGSFLGPGLERVDLGLMKNFKLGEHASLQMRAEAFNLFNHTSFMTIGTELNTDQFGQATLAHEPRIMQFSGKVNF